MLIVAEQVLAMLFLTGVANLLTLLGRIQTGARPTVQATFVEKHPKSGDAIMSIRSVFLAVLATGAVAVIAGTPLPQGFTDAVAKAGKPYLDAVAVVTNVANAAMRLQGVLSQEPGDSVNARHARFMLARIEHPEVFADLANEIQKWRKPSGERPGFLSGVLFQFVKRGPESKYVEERVRDKDGKIVFEPSGSTKGEVKLRGMRAKLVRVEKYTDAEVQAGIARNAAARQAVLEYFIKFLVEGDAYEQSEMVDLVNRLWGRGRSQRTADLAVVDYVQDADALIEAVFHDGTRPAVARMCAAFYLPDAKRPEVQAFMLNVVTNNPTDDRGHQSEDMVNRALAYLESLADANALAVLKNQTNGPTWKCQKIEKASHAK